jgi:DNA-binding PadR family transcriptional regulator
MSSEEHSREAVVGGARRRRRDEHGLLLGDWAALALLAERPSHGWALGSELGKTGQFGAGWSVGRPLVYRSLETLAELGLIEPVGHKRGARGPHRTIFQTTPAGASALDHWLRQPVEYEHAALSLLLVKVIFADRTGADYVSVLEAQHVLCAKAVRSLQRRRSASSKIDKVVRRFELESALAALRFVEWLIQSESADTTPPTAESLRDGGFPARQLPSR